MCRAVFGEWITSVMLSQFTSDHRRFLISLGILNPWNRANRNNNLHSLFGNCSNTRATISRSTKNRRSGTGRTALTSPLKGFSLISLWRTP